MATATDLARETGIKRGQVEDVLNLIVRHLQNGEVVKLVGFGTFTRRLRKGGVVKTPDQGEPIKYPDQFAIHFRASPIAKRRVNAPPRAKKKVKKKATKKVAKKR